MGAMMVSGSDVKIFFNLLHCPQFCTIDNTSTCFGTMVQILLKSYVGSIYISTLLHNIHPYHSERKYEFVKVGSFSMTKTIHYT